MADPVTAGEFADLMARAVGPPCADHVAVAVSGGPDSLALAVLTAQWAAQSNRVVTALTVDHGLRPESGEEARLTGSRLSSLGIRHQILHWLGAKPAAGLQAAARRARYRLLTGWCRRHAVRDLLVGHQRADQAETVLMRLVCGSGLDGLAAMAPMRTEDGVAVRRPLLEIDRARLIATLSARGLAWLEDPSNTDQRFTRTRAGAALSTLGGSAVAGRLVRLSHRAARARDALEIVTERTFSAVASVDPAGYVHLEAVGYAAAPAEIQLRMLARALAIAGGDAVPRRLQRLERLHDALKSRPASVATLAGCRIAWRNHDILVSRENRDLPAPRPLQAGRTALWDRRFLVRWSCRRSLGLRPTAPTLALRALGADGWRQAVAARPELARSTTLPYPVRLVLPSLWDNDRLLIAPHIGYCNLRPDDSVAVAVAVFRAIRPGKRVPRAARVIVADR